MSKRNVSYSLPPRMFNRLRKEAFKAGISMAGITRIIMESALDMQSGMKTYRPHVKKERVISDVTIRIQKGIKVRIV